MLECCSVNQAMFRSSRKILDGSFGLRSTFGLIFLTPAPFPAQNLTPAKCENWNTTDFATKLCILNYLLAKVHIQEKGGGGRWSLQK